jgi:hypothetical protein
MYCRLSWQIILISQLQCTVDWVDTLSWLVNYNVVDWVDTLSWLATCNVQSIELTHYPDLPTTMYSRLSWHIILISQLQCSRLSWHIILISQLQCTIDWADTLSWLANYNVVDWVDTLSWLANYNVQSIELTNYHD